MKFLFLALCTKKKKNINILSNLLHDFFLMNSFLSLFALCFLFIFFIRRCRELKEAYRQRPGIEQKRRNQERLRKIRAKKDRLATEERTIKYEESLVRNER